MLWIALVSAFVAATNVAAAPTADPILDALLDGDTHVFKRDAPLSARDLELAEMHEVDVTKMFKHSIIKRDDGDHFTIWVDNSFQEDVPALEKRQNARPQNTFGSGRSNSCRSYSYRGLTGNTSPWTGGIQAIVRWSNANSGHWFWQDNERRVSKNLVIGGSNRGHNARFAATMIHGDAVAWFGSTNVAQLTQESLNRYQRRTSDGWRAAAEGQATCDAFVWGQIAPFTRQFDWHLVRSNAIV